MRISIIASGGFGGLEQRYEIFDAPAETASIAGSFEGTAQTLGITAIPPSSMMPDGTQYELEIEDEDGVRRYAIDDNAAPELLAQLDELLSLLPILPHA
ncbi:MAG: hypothetical protein H6728_02370 [Myxococcales bacterium]|nr:hypothetical protein [Myxococcales bacterium]